MCVDIHNGFCIKCMCVHFFHHFVHKLRSLLRYVVYVLYIIFVCDILFVSCIYQYYL